MVPFVLLAALLLPRPAAPQPSVDSLEAKAQVRVCLSLAVEKAVAIEGCRRALALGLSPDWAGAIRLYLARRLADAMRWDDVVAVYRELVATRPRDAEAQLRLGHALLYGVRSGVEAELAYRRALSLAPDDPAAWASLGAALNTQARHPEAEAAFEQALALDPEYFDTHEAARVVYEASRRGQTWPPAEPLASP